MGGGCPLKVASSRMDEQEAKRLVDRLQPPWPCNLSYVHLIATGAIIKVYFSQVKWERAKCRTFKALAGVKG